jgi:hypothetical protein
LNKWFRYEKRRKFSQGGKVPRELTGIVIVRGKWIKEKQYSKDGISSLSMEMSKNRLHDHSEGILWRRLSWLG